ncbi:hypothetical protein B7463_g2509, partial [Scytalidium lignicola]
MLGVSRQVLRAQCTTIPLAVAAAAITVGAYNLPEGNLLPVIRPYTPVSDLSEPGFIDLAIKRYPKGKASIQIHSLSPGDSLFFLGSIKGYPWKLNEFRHITLIAGGAGITPMYQLIRGIFKNPNEKTRVTLIFGINSDSDALFRDEFAKYEKEFPDRFKVVYTVSHPSERSPDCKGYITKDLLHQVMPDSTEKSEKVFICGPPAMEASLLSSSRRGLSSQGVMAEIPSSARIAQMIGITGSFFLSGAISSLSIITVPALLESSATTPLLLQQWRSVFRKGAARAPVVAVVAGVAYGYATYLQSKQDQEYKFTIAAALTTIAIVPFTLIFMSKTNNTLLAGAAGISAIRSDETKTLLIKWLRLNAIRSLLPLVGGMLELWNIAIRSLGANLKSISFQNL